MSTRYTANYLPAAGGGGGSTGTLATTNASDTSAATGSPTVNGSLARTNASDTSSAAGTTTVTGSLARTNATDTVNASGAVGASISGALATTNANDSATASGTTRINGSSATTNANDAASASGTTRINGTAAVSNVNDAALASGIAGSIGGTAACVNANDVCNARGVGAPQSDASGGYIESMPRRRSVKEERERLGIIPREVKQIVQAVARASVVADKTDGEAERQLAERLAQQDIEAKARYTEFMQQERDRILARDIDRAMKIRQRQYEIDEDDREAEMLLM